MWGEFANRVDSIRKDVNVCARKDSCKDKSIDILCKILDMMYNLCIYRRNVAVEEYKRNVEAQKYEALKTLEEE